MYLCAALYIVPLFWHKTKQIETDCSWEQELQTWLQTHNYCWTKPHLWGTNQGMCDKYQSRLFFEHFCWWNKAESTLRIIDKNAASKYITSALLVRSPTILSRGPCARLGSRGTERNWEKGWGPGPKSPNPNLYIMQLPVSMWFSPLSLWLSSSLLSDGLLW